MSARLLSFNFSELSNVGFNLDSFQYGIWVKMQKLSYLGKNRTVCFSQWNPRKNNGLWNQPISSEQTSALKAGQVAIVVDNMEEFSEENLPNFSIFSSSNTNERFPWLQEEEIGHLHDDVILLLRPESFSFFLSYFNLVIPARFL